MRPGASLGNPAVPCVDDRTVFRISPPTVRRQVVATTPGGFMGVTATPRDGDRTAFRDLPSLRHDQQLFVMSPDHSISDPATPRADDCVALSVSPSSVRCHAFVLPQQRSLISHPTNLRADDRATFPHFALIVFLASTSPNNDLAALPFEFGAPVDPTIFAQPEIASLLPSLLFSMLFEPTTTRRSMPLVATTLPIALPFLSVLALLSPLLSLASGLLLLLS